MGVANSRLVRGYEGVFCKLIAGDIADSSKKAHAVASLKTQTTGNLLDLSFAKLEGVLAAAGLRPAHSKPLWRAVHREGVVDLKNCAHFPPPLRRWCDETGWTLEVPPTSADTASTDGLTRKFLLKLEDGQTIETVLMGYTGRHTACVSTQAGCAMGCVFCATGQMGFVRHLRPGEIVAQVLHVNRHLAASGTRLRNLVLMGMGEPLHNYDAVMEALEIISDTGGANIGPSRITISTVGVVPGILRLAEERRPYSLAVSLHGADEQERSALVPVSNKWPLAELIEACRHYSAVMEGKIFFGWTLIAGKNDSVETARRLAALLTGIRAHVNLIPLNPTDGFAGRASLEKTAEEFQRTLLEAGIPSTFRQRRGIDVAAGCGQLRAERRQKTAVN
jgi:23S rRNA (adenine2503-C2)-methyltransferase